MSEHRLDEITIERPRGGMRISLKKLTGYKKTLQKITNEATEDGLLRPYLIKKRRGTKHLSDHLGPLYRYLHSKVGQPWDDVYSVLCQNLDSSTLSGQHIIGHLWDYVERSVVLIDGVPYRKDRQEYPLGGFYGCRKHQFYIHPDTGILCIAPKGKKPAIKRNDELLVLDDRHQYRRLDGIWYLITLENILPMQKPIDVVLKSAIAPYLAWQEYGREVYAVSKKQCSRKEIKFILAQLAKK